ncbi:MAG: sulfotransferase [Hormoscilla sp.]
MTQTNKQRPRPILMTPIRRCGSHAIRLRLNFSREFYSPYPLHIVDFLPLIKLYGDLNDDDIYFQLVLDMIGLQNANMRRWDKVSLDPVDIFEAVKEGPRSPHAIAWEMLFFAGEQHHAKVVMDKSLDNIHDFEELIDLFDDIKFLNIVRDPRAQVNSINLSIIHEFDTVLNALTWVKAHEAAKKLAEKYPKKVLTIRYEDFLKHQELVIRKVCQFVGIKFFDDMLDVFASSEAQNLSQLSALWENNAFDPIVANIDKFSKSLTQEEINIIETITSEYMERYGYKRITKGSTQITQEMIERAKSKSLKRKQEAWISLKQNAPRDYQLRMFRANYLRMVEERLRSQQF